MISPKHVHDRSVYRIKIPQDIIKKYIANIDDSFLEEKINKQITKLIKNKKDKPNLKNKLYHYLLNLGYPSEMILDNLNKYDM